MAAKKVTLREDEAAKDVSDEVLKIALDQENHADSEPASEDTDGSDKV